MISLKLRGMRNNESGGRKCPLCPEAGRQGRATVPQLGLFVQGDFRGTIDWTSQAAESRPQIDLKGSFVGGIQGRF
jgi:hypothetical protein